MKQSLFLFLLAIISLKSSAQCSNTISLPDSIHLCHGDTTTIHTTITGSDSILNISWLPVTGLSNPAIASPVLSATSSGWYYITMQTVQPTNLVVNGDFSAGNTGFSSSYTYVSGPGSLVPASTYAISTDPHNEHSGAYSFHDHTTGSGNMMAINGASTPIDVWCQTISVTPNTWYSFSSWFSNWSNDTTTNLPLIQFEINGSLLSASAFTFPGTPGLWSQFYSTWYSGSSTVATICIHDDQTATFGNDFAIDDISFTPLCVVRDSFYFSLNVPDTIRQRHDTTVCNGVVLLTAPAGYAPYLWSTGSTSTAIGVGTSGVYSVKGTAGCNILRDTFAVTFGPPPTVHLGNDTAFCVGDSITLSSPEPAGVSYLWNTGSTASSIVASATGTYWLQVSNGCLAADTIHVLVSPHPVVNLGPDTVSCFDLSILLHSSVSYTAPTYLWSTGSTAPALPVATGTYWLWVTDQGCSGSDTINVTLKYDTLHFYSRDTAICKGNVINGLAAINPLATCQWLPTTGIPVSTIPTPLITADTSAEYRILVYMAGCPVISDSFHLDIQPNPTIYAGGNRFVCAYDTIHINAPASPGWYAGYTYTWGPSASLDDTTTANVVFTAGASHNYTVTVTTPAGCKAVDSAYITAYASNFASISPSVHVCPHDSVQFKSSGGGQYAWTPGTYLSDSTTANPWLIAITNVDYTLVVTSPTGGCKDTLHVHVNVEPSASLHLPDSVVTIHPGESYQMTPATNCTNFSWFPTEGLSWTNQPNPVATPTSNTNYIVYGTTEYGCTAVDSVYIIVSPESVINFPNAFTPGTGPNNTLYILKEGIASVNHYTIFDRWGKKVFNTNNIDEGWDGKFHGVPQPIGVYVYDIEVVTFNGQVVKKAGNITLLR